MAAPTVTVRTLVDSKDIVQSMVHIATGGDTDLTVTNVLDISAMTTGQTVSDCSIIDVKWSLNGFSATLNFDASTDVPAIVLSGNGEFNLREVNNGNGITNNSGSGKNGDILLATSGVGSTDNGWILITAKKQA